MRRRLLANRIILRMAACGQHPTPDFRYDGAMSDKQPLVHDALLRMQEIIGHELGASRSSE
jgi:hypothetical protein